MPVEARLVPVAVVVVLAIVARLARALTTQGAVAAVGVGVAIALGHGGPGLGVLGAFFVLGSVATKVGWAKKQAEGTAERGGGARDAQRVLGKGGAAALASALAALGAGPETALAAAVTGALAAALADTLGTEIGILSNGRPRLLPAFRPVPRGTPGAVSIPGTLAAAGGALLIGATAWGVGLLSVEGALLTAAAGFAGAMVESVVTSLAPGVRAVPGWVRNVLTTAVGGALAAVAVGGIA